MTLCEGGKTSADQLVILDEFYETETHVRDAIRWLAVHDKPRGTIHSDHAPTDQRVFSSAGFEAINAEKDRESGVSEVSKRFQAGGAMPLSESGGSARGKKPRKPPSLIHTDDRTGERIEIGTSNAAGTSDSIAPDAWQDDSADSARVGLLVSSDCENLIRELFSYQWDEFRKQTGTDHAVDSLRYLCMGVSDGGSDSGPIQVPSTW